MVIFHDPQSANYGSAMRPEQPARITKTTAHLRSAHADWEWRMPALASEETLLLAHAPAHLERLTQPLDFDSDTPFFPGIYDHARRSVGAAIAAAEATLATRVKTFSLMRPPGHHASATQAMGFCYLNQIAVTALYVRQHLRVSKVGVWDFDAHHGNGTEAILRGRNDIVFASVHQFPGYPGTGTQSFDNCHNWPVAPGSSREQHMAALRESLDTVVSFAPDLILVSAGFDAFARDPITAMSLEIDDFATLGRWLRETGYPATAILEGGYSSDLPLLMDAFLSAWER